METLPVVEELRKLKKEDLVQRCIALAAATSNDGAPSAIEERLRTYEETVTRLEQGFTALVTEQEQKLAGLTKAQETLAHEHAALLTSHRALGKEKELLTRELQGLQGLRKELDEARRTLARDEEERKTNLQELTRLRAENHKLKEEVIAELLRLEEELKLKENDHRKVLDKMRQMGEEHERILSEKGKLGDELDQLRHEFQERLAALEGEKTLLSAEADKVRGYDQLKRDYDHLLEEHDELKTVIRHELDLLEKEVEGKENLFAQANQMIRELEESKNRTIEELRSSKGSLEGHSRDLEERFAKLDLQHQDLVQQYQNLRERAAFRLAHAALFKVKRYGAQYPTLARLFVDHLVRSGVRIIAG